MARDYYPAFVRLRSRPSGTWLVHPDLRGAIVEDAKRQGVSMTDAVVKVLAKKYKVPYEVTLRATAPAVAGEELNLRLPLALYEAIRVRLQHPESIPDAVRAALSAHYGLKLPAKVKQTRQRRTAAA